MNVKGATITVVNEPLVITSLAVINASVSFLMLEMDSGVKVSLRL